MLFNSGQFIFLFLPLTLAIYYGFIRLGLRRYSLAVLVAASLVFYAAATPKYVLLLLASVAGNYCVGWLIERRKAQGRSPRMVLTLGVLANLALLGYYKYTNFLIENLNAFASTDFVLEKIILPLGVSFYTLQQIAYLVDVERGEAQAHKITRYMTFMIFFPQLFAGPIVHYKDMVPQFFGRDIGRFWRADMLVGLIIFAIGLFKKTVIADSAAVFASPVFDAVHAGEPISLLMGWQAAICYTIQVYFDFSGYSDMAVGVARMFGVRLPPNFHSPLRAGSIMDYWRRWHITLQQFIVSYMYQPIVIPLARFGAARGYGKWPTFWLTAVFPTVVVFIVVGLWHGAGWTFVLFGLMHGIYLATNESWRMLRRKGRRKAPPGGGSVAFYHVLTLLCVVAANVMFRSETPADAVRIWAAMLSIGTVPPPPADALELLVGPLPVILISAALLFLFPNTQQLMARYRPVWNWDKWRNVAPPVLQLSWRPTVLWAVWTGLVLFFGIIFISRTQGEFIYFNF